MLFFTGIMKNFYIEYMRHIYMHVIAVTNYQLMLYLFLNGQKRFLHNIVFLNRSRGVARCALQHWVRRAGRVQQPTVLGLLLLL